MSGHGIRIALALTAGLLLAGCATQDGVAAPSSSPPGTTAAPALEPGTTLETVAHDTRDRTYRLTVPAAAADEPLPVVVALHGAGQSAEVFDALTGLPAAAIDRGFVLVTPDGAGPDAAQTWNAGGCCGTAAADDVDDVGLIGALLDDVDADLTLDRDRVYLTGFSNGGMLSYRVACELGDVVAGIAVVAGAWNADGCEAPDAVGVLAVHGTADAVVPFEGGPPQAEIGLPPFENRAFVDSVAPWLARNGCGEPTARDDGIVTTTEWAGCAVTTVVVDGGTHVWFGGAAERAGATPAGGPDATALALAAFGLD